jgi:hypothetical protein
MRNALTTLQLVNLNGRDWLGDISTDGRIILKWILQEYVEDWVAFM